MKMKIISLFQSEKALLRKAKSGNREAQKALYDQYAPMMLATCRRYIKDLHFAEDVMIEGFVKVFKNLHSFRWQGSFEGWMRRIMIREAIDFLRKRQFVVFDQEQYAFQSSSYQPGDSLELEQLEELIDQLPEGYRLVFVLYAIEGYKHAEIAQMLEITEGTSKSQLFKARRILQEQIQANELSRYGTR
ncbi:RNA polymerase sigma factor [Robiginitalea sp. IMCC43444]|uniref:RNA polymerase sigma factor n=1 Tax=Robiginitalea sp. IMCC43444 TaxID=3459121 RepID=UPI0040436550